MGRQEAQEGLTRQYPGDHEARHQEAGEERWGEKDLRPDLRGDSRGSQGVSGECDPGRCDLHRARQEEDRDRNGRGVCPQETGSHSVWLRWLNFILVLYSDVMAFFQIYVY